jgi:hypothetical protein
MSCLSEVTVLISQRAGELEKAREVFIAETRAFVASILGAIKRARSEPWVQGRARIDFPREGEAEGTSAVSLESQFARCQLRFRKEMTFRQVADVRFGIEFEQSSDAFLWQVVLVPTPRYPRMDDLLWDHWRSAVGASLASGSAHQVKSNTVCFVQRPVTAELTGDVAFNDVKLVLETLLGAGAAMADAVGLEPED